MIYELTETEMRAVLHALQAAGGDHKVPLAQTGFTAKDAAAARRAHQKLSMNLHTPIRLEGKRS